MKGVMMPFFAFIGLGISLLVVTIVVIAIGGFIGAIPLYFLWNWLMPDLFGI